VRSEAQKDKGTSSMLALLGCSPSCHQSPAAEPPSWNEAAVAAAFASAKAAAPAAAKTGASAEEAICLDLDEEDPLTFLLKAGGARASSRASRAQL